MAIPIGERVATVEEKVDNLREQFAEHRESVNGKLDQIIAGIKVAADESAKNSATLGSLSEDVKTMKPHVETVAAAKTFGAVAGLISVKVTALIATIYAFWSWTLPYIKLPWHR